MKGKKIWEGKFIGKEYWSWEEFRPKSIKGYDFKPDPSKYDKQVFKDYQIEMDSL